MSLPRRLWALRRERPVFVLLTAVTLGAVLVWPLVDAVIRGMSEELQTAYAFYDFGAYSGAVEGWLSGGPIYTPDGEGGYRGSFLYPPLTLLFYYPFASVPFDVGGTLMGAFSVVCLWVGLELVARELGLELGVGERFLLLLAVFAFQPVNYAFKMGQMGTFLTAVLCLGFYAHERHRATGRRSYAYLSGVLTTLASSFKLFYATSGAHLLRDRRRLAAALLTAVAFVVASVLAFGVDAHRVYLDVLTWGKGWGEAPRSPTAWGPAYFRPLYVFGSAGFLLKLLGILAVVGLTVAAREGPADRATFALGVASIPLFAPEAYTHDLPVLLLPAVVLLAVELDRDGYPALPVLAVLLTHLHAYGLRFLTHPPEWLPLADLWRSAAGWLQPGLWATLILVGLAAARVATHARLPSKVTEPTEGVSGD
jgi:hypothetical protein